MNVEDAIEQELHKFLKEDMQVIEYFTSEIKDLARVKSLLKVIKHATANELEKDKAIKLSRKIEGHFIEDIKLEGVLGSALTHLRSNCVNIEALFRTVQLDYIEHMHYLPKEKIVTIVQRVLTRLEYIADKIKHFEVALEQGESLVKLIERGFEVEYTDEINQQQTANLKESIERLIRLIDELIDNIKDAKEVLYEVKDLPRIFKEKKSFFYSMFNYKKSF